MSSIFGVKYEQNSIDFGIAERQYETGFTVPWWFFDQEHSRVDSVYDEGSFATAGRRWKGPFPMPLYSITRTEGRDSNADGGFYTVDKIMVWMSYRQAVNAGFLPAPDQTNEHLKDRFVFDNKVWSPDSIVSRNLLGGGGTRSMVVIEATEVRADEMDNDDQFQKYATPTTPVVTTETPT